MPNSKHIEALQNLVTLFNPTFVKINRDSESQMNYVRTSVLLSF